MNSNHNKAHIIVISNEKGGTGKSTISMHLAIKLLNEGFKIATMDLDARQGTLSKYIENRRKFCTAQNISLPTPKHFEVHLGQESEIADKINALSSHFDAIIIDTPGTKNQLFEEAHQYADTIITPISDSLIDLNVIADIDFQTGKMIKIGHYADFIWEVKKNLAAKGKSYLNWIVVGNKTSNLKSKNKSTVFSQLEKLSKTYGFRLNDGLKDRVIYKELFLEGLTVLDMRHEKLKMKMNLSHLAAKREIQKIAEFISPE